MKKALLWLCAIAATGAMAQTVPGTYKRTAMVLTDATGKQTDLLALTSQSMPCTAQITYTFKADNSFSTQVPASCGDRKSALESMNTPARWSVSGNQLKVITQDKSQPDALYTLTYGSNTMTWTFNYTANPQTPNPTQAKQLVVTYQRL
jgi:hypothetical protein